MTNGRNYRGNVPRRRIEKVWSRLNSNITTSITEYDLHTVEDAKTLVRMRVDFGANRVTGSPYADLNISVYPADTSIAGCSVTESLDNDDSKHTLFRRMIAMNTSDNVPQYIEFDSKAMRKLNVGDKIVLQTKADVAASIKLVGYVTLWFKE